MSTIDIYQRNKKKIKQNRAQYIEQTLSIDVIFTFIFLCQFCYHNYGLGTKTMESKIKLILTS